MTCTDSSKPSSGPHPAKGLAVNSMKTVFDFGVYDASDTTYYLEQGFKVVAVEANKALADGARKRLSEYVDKGQLHVIHAAISQDGQPVRLTICGDDLGSSSIFEGNVA